MDLSRSCRFESKLQAALAHVRTVLDATKVPCSPADVDHEYQDKYILAERVTNAAIASQVNLFTSLGLRREQLAQLSTWVEHKTVSLEFKKCESCQLDRKETRRVESPTHQVTEIKDGSEATSSLTSKVVTLETDYIWRVEVEYELVALRGVGEESSDRLSMLSGSNCMELKTTVEAPPPALKKRAPKWNCQVDISWLIKCLNTETFSPCFEIDRNHAMCFTPRRNPDIAGACQHFAELGRWTSTIVDWLASLLQASEGRTLRDFRRTCSAFVPVLPIFIESNKGDMSFSEGPAPAEQAGVLVSLPEGGPHADFARLGIGDMNCLLAEEARSLRLAREAASTGIPGTGRLFTSGEAVLTVSMDHSSEVCKVWQESVDYIEGMLCQQLCKALGTVVSVAEFAEYMRFHNRRMFVDAYAPSPFCFAVRRSERHSPEGSISIEDSIWKTPIMTLASKISQQGPMQLPLSASTHVTFGGDRYLHAFLSHQFSSDADASLSLVSRARHFSSMIVLIGRIASAHVFEPQHAAIVKNGDELTIPLSLSMIPTPKDFKDAISSLSSEQQKFAKAFRSMQLESTLFGLLVIQIKPQLEKVLNLPDNSLTKEIKLTQDLTDLFMKYQIPTDLLSFDTEEAELVGGPTSAERLEAVRVHVKAMQDMIDEEKRAELEEQARQAAWAEAQRKKREEEEAEKARKRAEAEAEKASLFGSGAEEEGQEVIFTENTAPDREVWDEKGGVIKKGACEISERPSFMDSTSYGSLEPTVLEAEGGPSHSAVRDLTQVPKEMNDQFEKLDSDNALRPTIIHTGYRWAKKSQKGLLAAPSTTWLSCGNQRTEKDAAFDLLDALTKSGALPVEHASLHVIVAATHCFDKSVLETVIQDNLNPIEKVERSTLIMASTVHGLPPAELVREVQRQRLQVAWPQVFLGDAVQA